MPHYKLTYFPVTALAEPIRFLFSYGGIEFEDVRFNRADWPQLKDSTPFGKLPVLEVDGKRIHQSVAISRYVAKIVGLAGKDDWEALEIDATVETIHDICQKLASAHYEQHADAEGKAARQALAKEIAATYFKRLDAQVQKNGGYLVGGALTWADLTFVALLELFDWMMGRDTVENYKHLKELTEKVLAIPAIKAWVAKRPASVIT